MSIIIDRRLNSKNKNIINRQRFLRRYRVHVKKAVLDAVNQRSITEIDSGSDIQISKPDLSEPFFHHGIGGKHYQVHLGNKEFSAGDRIQRSSSGEGLGGDRSKYGVSEYGEDEFVFQIDRDEFLEYLFDDLELPNLVIMELKDRTKYKLQSVGFTSTGTPARLSVIRSLRSAYARRIALSGKDRKHIRTLKRRIREMEVSTDELDQQSTQEVREQIKELTAMLKKSPLIDDFDLKYNSLAKTLQPSSRAVMFCVMDVSGSMTRKIKDIAKRFFLLLYLFLKRKYEEVKVVFIRHHSKAIECNENDFFYARETGGTVVSTALTLTSELMKKRYPSEAWNIYVAQASDGDNWEEDSSKCRNIIINKILPMTQYYSYVEITDRNHQNLWQEYKVIEKENVNRFAIQQIRSHNDIYPVFRRLFEKKEAYNA